jgi:MFS family permease
MAETENSAGSAGRVAFTYPDFRHYQYARFIITLALEMQSVAVGWQIYEVTRRPLDLGLAGLAQFLPGVLLFLVSGNIVDRFNRRNLLAICYCGFVVCSGLLLGIAWRGVHSVSTIYAVLVLVGVVRSLNGPVSRAILPQLVKEEHFANAIAWHSTIFQTATILGPTVGGLAYVLFRGAAGVYALAMVTAVAAVLSTTRIQVHGKGRPREPVNWNTVMAGLHFIWNRKLVLGVMSLDLFAVLLGGAVALLPVYARDVLRTGPWGLGLLRTAPGIGAAATAILLAHRPLRGKIGGAMLWCVAGFGVFTVVFGLSRNLILSMVALLMVGATDMVSVVVRGILVQLATPDEVRGRVNAVEMIFIGASNEFGQFESGVTASWFGTVPAVVIGGIGALVVSVLWAVGFPELRRGEQPVGGASLE